MCDGVCVCLRLKASHIPFSRVFVGCQPFPTNYPDPLPQNATMPFFRTTLLPVTKRVGYVWEL